MIAREGNNVTLKCAATGSPTPNITWRKESGERIMLNQSVEGENKKKKFSFS
jgi:neurotrimin